MDTCRITIRRESGGDEPYYGWLGAVGLGFMEI